jgi:3-dehydroquinate synthase
MSTHESAAVRRYNFGMTTLSVNIPVAAAQRYEVQIQGGLLATLGALVKRVAPAPSCAIITDSNVAGHYLPVARTSLEDAGYRVIVHVLPAGEEHKTIGNAVAAMEALLHAKVERATPVIALGGGVVGDVAGFVAATLLRGVPLVQVPTTLLAAVDASVGGKVGVDHAAGKNLIGAFHQPRLVVTDIETFQTLPDREICGGLAECIKHAVIRDASLFMFITDNAAKLAACDGVAMGELVARNVAIKAAIVEADPFEHGVRALLNFGHTFGHAIENVLEYRGVTHGEGVALGMVAAGRLASRRGMFSAVELERLVTLIDYVGLPTSHAEIDVERAFAAMGTDKKVVGGKLRLILPRRIGEAEVVTGVSDAEIRMALRSLRGASEEELQE